jgi:transposase InsO family protein
VSKSNKLRKNVSTAGHAGDVWKLEWQRTDMEWALLVTDVASGILLFRQLTNCPNTLEAIKTVEMAFARFGLPRSIETDHGIEFAGSQFRDLLEWSGVYHVIAPPTHTPNRLRRTRT